MEAQLTNAVLFCVIVAFFVLVHDAFVSAVSPLAYHF